MGTGWSTFSNGLVPSVTYDNQVYAAPLFTDNAFLFYRKDLLQKANLPVPTTWEQLRLADRPFPLPDGPLDPTVARWMDDGFFARWVLGAYPHLGTTAIDLKDLLGPPLGPLLLEALVWLLE